jgi:choline dehydrogenase-like flavoprotein
MKSPQILELSGIGNPSILSSAGIKCVVDNARVGENFQDHSATGIGYELVEGEKTLDMLQQEPELQAAMASYTTDKSGPLSSGGAAMGFASYADLAIPSEVKSLQELILSDKYPGHDEATKKLIANSLGDHNYGSLELVLLAATLDLRYPGNQKVLLQPPPEQQGKHGLVLAACLARPLSVGTIHITSSDPKIDPAIDPAYLTHPADIEVFVKGLELLKKMAATSPFKEKIKRKYHPVELDLGDRKSVEEYLRNTCATEYHPLGTVAMGKKGVGAVDDRLKVWGAKGVRVVDASVMPLHVSGNIVSSVYAIAEKASDMIKEDWGL